MIGMACTDLAAAVRRELRHISAEAVDFDVSDNAVVVPGSSGARGDAVVAAAVEDDGNPGRVLRYAAARAVQLSIPLRVVHVWTGGTDAGARRCRPDGISDADRLLSAVLYDHLPPEAADAAEREILHYDDPVNALLALSGDASLLVVGARSGPPTPTELLGDTARALVGRTTCPLAVLPAVEENRECSGRGVP
jgi:nucleotide-binding universal stress UspA family protein